MWALKLQASANFLLHRLQEWGLSPVKKKCFLFNTKVSIDDGVFFS